MKKLIVFLTIWFALTATSCSLRKSGGFAIYLLSQDMSASDATKMDLKQLPLENVPLISDEDIIAYELTHHSIELSPAAYQRFQMVFPKQVRVDGIPFVVCVGEQRIYSGALWTPASSLSYDGIIILQSFDNEKTSIQITLGYPGPEAFTGSDPRGDPRIVSALEQARKLKSDSE